MPMLTTCLWFDGQAEEAARFYVSLFPNSRLGRIAKAPKGIPVDAGKALTVEFELDGQKFMGLNGGPDFKFNEAISLVIPCKDQAEVDRYWNALIADGGEEGPCGWCKDRFGVSWQVTPTVLTEAMAKGGEVAERAAAAFMPMKKLDVAKIEAAIREAEHA
jgi:predicted 3-demethylubiquinone-9 3-methyltransferase (glyoxalase superfamily)